VKEKPELDIEHFKIDGTIHGKAFSKYIDEQIEVNKQKQRLAIVVLSVVAALFFMWAAISQYRCIAMEKKIAQTKIDKKNIQLLNQELKQSDRILDSMQNVVYRLQKENAYLAESSDKAQGVFFEVQLGTFSNFNLNDYEKNLENLRQTNQKGQNILTLGRFRSFKQALLFEKELKQIGIENAFVVGRIDDQIVSYQEALNAQNKSNK
jgi:hypothetical protein